LFESLGTSRIPPMEFDHQRLVSRGEGTRALAPHRGDPSRSSSSAMILRGSDRTLPPGAEAARRAPLFASAAEGIRTRREAEKASFERMARQGPAGPSKRAGRASNIPRRCARCGSVNDAAARFCDQCGRRIPPGSASVPGLVAATQAALARELEEDAARLAGREGISVSEARERVRAKPRTKGLLRQYGG
jgi:hypothetical protein